MSPRIAWFGFLRACSRSARLIIILALAAGAGWGVWYGAQRAFLDNPEFQLRQVELNPNQAIDEAELVKAAGIDLHSNLFDLDVEEIRGRLAARPAIAAVTVERHLPSTLTVHVTARTPKAWIALSDADIANVRQQGNLLVDSAGAIYACAPQQWEIARELPIVLLPKASAPEGLVAGKVASQSELQRSFRLLDTAVAADPEANRWIDRIEQKTTWSLEVTTRSGTIATFGLGNHERQMTDFSAALDHATRQGYGIATINLIPQRNIPITTRDEAAPPRAVPVPEPTQEEIRTDRRSKDLKSLLNRG